MNVLERPCTGDEHTLTAGQNTKPAGAHTKEFAQAVVKGHKRMRKSKEGVWTSYPTEVMLEREEGALRGPTEDLTVEKGGVRGGRNIISSPYTHGHRLITEKSPPEHGASIEPGLGPAPQTGRS